MQIQLPYSNTAAEKAQNQQEFPENYTIIDIETTGLSSLKNEIIELCAIKIRNNKIVETFTTLVKPQAQINSFISNLTGISNDMVSNAPKIENILNKYIEFISDDIVIGHNVKFDIGFINTNSLKYYNKEFANKYIDTCGLSRKITPIKRHKLELVAQYYEIDTTGHHRAEQDCLMTFGIYNAMKNTKTL